MNDMIANVLISNVESYFAEYYYYVLKIFSLDLDYLYENRSHLKQLIQSDKLSFFQNFYTYHELLSIVNTVCRVLEISLDLDLHREPVANQQNIYAASSCLVTV